jgi:hypothetical protein
VAPVADHRRRPGLAARVYLLKLVAATGQRYVPLTIRDDRSHAALVVQDAVTTWQAYNRWGGRSLYVGPDGSLETRSRGGLLRPAVRGRAGRR